MVDKTIIHTMWLILQEFDGPLALNLSPTHRRFATLCPLIDPDVVGKQLCPGGPSMEQTLFLLWGKMSHQQIIEDGWLFHCDDMTWNKVRSYICT